MTFRGYWDPLIAQLRADGVRVMDNRPKGRYARSTSSDQTFGLHDSANSRLADPTNRALRQYDVVAGRDKDGPYVMFNRWGDQQRGSVYGANRFAGPQIAYAGPVGRLPGDQTNQLLTRTLNYAKGQSPDFKFKGHGELYKSDPRYSKHGRGPTEGLWGQNWRDGTTVTPAVPKAGPVQTRSLVAHAGLTQPPQLVSGPTPAKPPMALGGPPVDDTLPPVDVPMGPPEARPVGPPQALKPIGPETSMMARPDPSSLPPIEPATPVGPPSTTLRDPGFQPYSGPVAPSPSQSQSASVGATPPAPVANPQRAPAPAPQPVGPTWSQAMQQQMMGGGMMLPGQQFAPAPAPNITPKNNALINLLGGFF